jgi:hypothetical protein
MNYRNLTASALAGMVLASVAGAQTIETVATETFEYNAFDGIDGQVGGFGWFQQWYAGGAGYVDGSGLDGVGGAALTDGNNAGAYRSPKTGPWLQTVGAGFNFGGGDGTMWLSFNAQRPAGYDSKYGGLSLHTSFVGEKLFIGSPFESNEWGVAIPGCCDFRIAGSDVTQNTRIVCRIDYQPGDERFRMWLNPAEAHPASGADLDIVVTDHNWNEIRLQSGEGPTANGWLWDDIVIECQDCTPQRLLCDTTSINAFLGGTASLEAYGGVQNEGDLYVFAGSLSGTSPGLPLAPGVLLPLNPDGYTNLCLGSPAASGLSAPIGNLDLDGKAFTTFTLPSLPQLAGNNVSFAFVVFDLASLSIELASNAVSISLL